MGKIQGVPVFNENTLLDLYIEIYKLQYKGFPQIPMFEILQKTCAH